MPDPTTYVPPGPDAIEDWRGCATADALMAIFGMRRKSDESERTAPSFTCVPEPVYVGPIARDCRP